MRPFIPSIGQPLSSPALAVEQLLDNVGNWLSSLPAGPATDFLAGGLLLVRRGLFNQTPTVAPRVLVGEVLRPMRPEEGSTFATSLIGEVVGTLGAVDPEGAVLSYALSRSPQFGAVRVDPDGTWSYTPSDASAALEDAFTVSINDGGWNILDPFASPAEVTVGVRPGLSSSSNKPGLIASDWLEVVNTTGEYFGDEPVIVTVMLTTTLGQDGGTRTRLVDSYPNQIKQGVDAGDKIEIPNVDGDAWIDYAATDSYTFRPLTLESLLRAQEKGAAAPIPIVATVTLMLEGDLSQGDNTADMGRLIERALKEVGVVLESTKIVIPPLKGAVDEGAIGKINPFYSTFDEALAAIKDTFTIDPWKGNAGWLGYAVDAVLERLELWAKSFGDPDDPVGLSATVMIPVDENLLTGIGNVGYDPRTFCEERGACAVDYIRVTSGGRYSTLPEVILRGGDAKNAATIRLISDRGVDGSGNQYFYVKGVEVTGKGSGYSTAPTVEFVGGQSLVTEDTATAMAFLDKAVLNEDYIGLTKKEIRTPLWDTTIELRYGFLAPPGEFYDKQPQGWTTLYVGDYVDNDEAQWKVETQAWPQVNW